MSLWDFAKAFGVALLIMVLNIAIAFAVVWAFSNFIEPGRDYAYYQAAAERISPWSSLVAGIVLFGLAGWEFARRRPARNGVMFAAVFAAIYIAVDVAIVVAVGALSALGGIVAASMLTKFAAAVGGAYFARPAKD